MWRIKRVEGDGKTHLSGCAQLALTTVSRVSETLDTDKISVRQQAHAFLPDLEGRGAAAQTFPPQTTPNPWIRSVAWRVPDWDKHSALHSGFGTLRVLQLVNPFAAKDVRFPPR